MPRKRLLVVVIAGLAPLALIASMAYAAERTLEFQLVTKALDPRTLEAPNIEGQTITQSKAFGVTVSKDGRIGTKEFIFASDMNKGVGTYFGYSTYTFDDGTLTTRFSFASGPQGGHGEYKILSGTGAYAGASGTGTFDGVPSTIKNANFYKVKLQVVTP